MKNLWIIFLIMAVVFTGRAQSYWTIDTTTPHIITNGLTVYTIYGDSLFTMSQKLNSNAVTLAASISALNVLVTNYIGTNLPPFTNTVMSAGVIIGWGIGTNRNGTIIETNFIDGNLYTNNYGYGITVVGKVVNTVAAIAGSSDESLMCLCPPAIGGWTNDSAIQSTILSVAMVYTNTISLFVPTNAPYCFTNFSTGAGNSAAVVGGQIKYP